MLHTEVLEPRTLGVLKDMMALESLAPFALVGGTALALQFGHRLSLEDIASMKLSAITNRGAKKDFYDIYELSNRFGFAQLCDW